MSKTYKYRRKGKSFQTCLMLGLCRQVLQKNREVLRYLIMFHVDIWKPAKVYIHAHTSIHSLLILENHDSTEYMQEPNKANFHLRFHQKILFPL